MSETIDPLWTPEDLARFMGLSRATIQSMISRAPDRLPPRVNSISKPRWVPRVCQEWAERQSSPLKRKAGRPRLSA